MAESPVAAWYPDPDGSGLRYWDGAQWTQDRAPAAPAIKAASGGWGWRIAGVVLILLGIGGISNAFSNAGDFGKSGVVAAFALNLLLPIALGVGGFRCVTHPGRAAKVTKRELR